MVESIKYRIFSGASTNGVNENVIKPTADSFPFTADSKLIFADNNERFADENYLIE